MSIAPALIQRSTSHLTSRRLHWGELIFGVCGFLLPEIFNDQATELVVLEIATNAFRGRGEPVWYRDAFNDVVAFFGSRGIRLAVLDLPRHDLDPDADWMADFHRDSCAQYSLPYRKVDLQLDLLRDGVHATSKGHDQYARELAELLKSSCPEGHEAPTFAQHSRKYNLQALSCADISSQSFERETYSRSGYTTNLLLLPELEECEIALPPSLALVGFSAIRGPLGGDFQITHAAGRRKFTLFDRWSYYDRLDFFLIPRLIGIDSISLSQMPGIPEIKLLKGEIPKEPRVAKIGHLLFEQIPPA